MKTMKEKTNRDIIFLLAALIFCGLVLSWVAYGQRLNECQAQQRGPCMPGWVPPPPPPSPNAAPPLTIGDTVSVRGKPECQGVIVDGGYDATAARGFQTFRFDVLVGDGPFQVLRFRYDVLVRVGKLTPEENEEAVKGLYEAFGVEKREAKP
jgi:hypothetical protein